MRVTSHVRGGPLGGHSGPGSWSRCFLVLGPFLVPPPAPVPAQRRPPPLRKLFLFALLTTSLVNELERNSILRMSEINKVIMRVAMELPFLPWGRSHSNADPA